MQLLTQAQARAVANAMAHLNNVGAVLHARIPVDSGMRVLHVKQYMTDEINVLEGDVHGEQFGGITERYLNQAEFLGAYGV